MICTYIFTIIYVHLYSAFYCLYLCFFCGERKEKEDKLLACENMAWKSISDSDSVRIVYKREAELSILHELQIMLLPSIAAITLNEVWVHHMFSSWNSIISKHCCMLHVCTTVWNGTRTGATCILCNFHNVIWKGDYMTVDSLFSVWNGKTLP